MSELTADVSLTLCVLFTVSDNFCALFLFPNLKITLIDSLNKTNEGKNYLFGENGKIVELFGKVKDYGRNFYNLPYFRNIYNIKLIRMLFLIIGMQVFNFLYIKDFI